MNPVMQQDFKDLLERVRHMPEVPRPGPVVSVTGIPPAAPKRKRKKKQG
jgi:hypothetical protein